MMHIIYLYQKVDIHYKYIKIYIKMTSINMKGKKVKNKNRSILPLLKLLIDSISKAEPIKAEAIPLKKFILKLNPM